MKTAIYEVLELLVALPKIVLFTLGPVFVVVAIWFLLTDFRSDMSRKD